MGHQMGTHINKYGKGILICLLIAIPSWIIGKMFPVIGGAVIAILAGMIIAMFWNDKKIFRSRD